MEFSKCCGKRFVVVVVVVANAAASSVAVLLFKDWSDAYTAALDNVFVLVFVGSIGFSVTLRVERQVPSYQQDVVKKQMKVKN